MVRLHQAIGHVRVALQCSASRAHGSKEKPFGYFDATLLGGWQVPGEPYTNAPGSDWMWWRARMLGGRTNHYGRISLRMGPVRFQALQPRRQGLRLAYHL